MNTEQIIKTTAEYLIEVLSERPDCKTAVKIIKREMTNFYLEAEQKKFVSPYLRSDAAVGICVLLFALVGMVMV